MPSKLNPCARKGRYGGRRYPGRIYKKRGKSVVVGGCECKDAMLSLVDGNQEKRLCYAMRFTIDGIVTVSLPDSNPRQDNEVVTVPCGETFRYVGSHGTRLFRDQMRQKPTKFRGCQAVEEELTKAGLLSHEPLPLGKRKDDFQSEVDRDDAPWMPSSQFDETFLDLLRGLPAEIVESHSVPAPLWELVERQVSTDREDPKRKKAFDDFLESLTPAQREAIDFVYLKNKKQRTKAKIAKQLGISAETLRDRLDQAIKKLVTKFPEYKRQRRRQRIDTSSDLDVGGFRRKSSSKHAAPVGSPSLESTAQKTKHDNTLERNWLYVYERNATR